MNADAIQETLMGLPVFAPLPGPLRDKVSALLYEAGKVLSLNAEDVLIREGDVGGGAGFVLLSGSMNISHEGEGEISIGAPALLGEMHQFNPRAQRTATVIAAGPCEVLKFAWFDFHCGAKSMLSPEEQAALMDTMEQLVWQRFQHESIFNVPAFLALEEKARLRLCLTLVWLAREEHFAPQALLFEQNDLQGGVGHVLIEGRVALFRAGQPMGVIDAPSLIGAATEFDPKRVWSARAAALNEVTTLCFEWTELEAYLIQRLGEDGTRAAFAAIESAARQGFVC